MVGKMLASMGKRRRPTYKNTFSTQRLCKLYTVTGQGKMVLVREKSGKSQGISISHLCGNPVTYGARHAFFVSERTRLVWICFDDPILKELEQRKLGWKVLILKYDLGKSLSKEKWCKMADTKFFLLHTCIK